MASGSAYIRVEVFVSGKKVSGFKNIDLPDSALSITPPVDVLREAVAKVAIEVMDTIEEKGYI